MSGNKSNKKKPLTMREAKFVKAKAEGLSNTQAALKSTGAKSYGSAQKMGHELSTKVNVQEALAEVYKAKGLTLDAIIQPFADGLKANRVAAVEGDFYETEVPDHTVRMNAGRTLAQLAGIGKNAESETTNINFINIAAAQKDNYTF
jgi:hypothetical protein